MLNKWQLEDMVLDTKKALKFYEGIKVNCTTCESFSMSRCKRADGQKIPEDFLMKGCDGWEYDEVPF